MSSKKEIQKELNFLRAARKRKTLRMVGGLVMTEAQYEEYKREFCPSCSRKLENPRAWFGELFCGDCVMKFAHGEGP